MFLTFRTFISTNCSNNNTITVRKYCPSSMRQTNTTWIKEAIPIRQTGADNLNRDEGVICFCGLLKKPLKFRVAIITVVGSLFESNSPFFKLIFRYKNYTFSTFLYFFIFVTIICNIAKYAIQNTHFGRKKIH